MRCRTSKKKAKKEGSVGYFSEGIGGLKRQASFLLFQFF
jgi:hypothetical protein